MNLRTIFLLLIAIVIALLAVLNWNTLMTSTTVSLGVTDIVAPLGAIMLGLTVLLCVFFLAYVLSLHGSVLMETRRHVKEMAAQRDLADKAELSRFTELRQFLETQQRQSQDLFNARMDAMEARVTARTAEAENVTAAFMGQLEDQLRLRGSSRPRLRCARPVWIWMWGVQALR
ncbi:LapA family protein [Diaphorobacter aerolatus]|uniref:LapA family protein n=1 Tax=Diaphorobacter aerolatus TaxID=1288495 RepID=UPI001D01BCFB|nr:LapA family protein [Diaphorobacter aerolatus]